MKKILSRILILIIFAVLLVGFIAYSRGYRLNIQDGKIVPTGIMAVTSTPKAAKIYVNGTFRGVTDTNLTLAPGSYTVEVKKEGFTSYKRDLKLKGEIVESIDALLFPVNPSLSPLTNLGITKAVAVDQTDRVILFIEGTEPERAGVYLFEANSGPISFFPPLKILTLKSQLSPLVNFQNVRVHFSPKFDQAILEFFENPVANPPGTNITYQISLTETNQEPLDITATKDIVLEAWIKEKQREYAKILETYPKAFQNIAYDGIRVVSFSPSETKLFYQAKRDLQLPLIIKPALIGSNQTPETRNLKKDSLYVYDRKEDKNFRVDFDPEALDSFLDKEKVEQLNNLIRRELQAQLVDENAASPAGVRARNISSLEYLFFENNSPVQWYPNSRNFVINEELLSDDTASKNKQFALVDYDGTNKQTVYSGPFEDNFYILTAEGEIVILANLNPRANLLPDLYAVGIR